MGCFVIQIATDQTNQGFISIQRKARQLNDVAVGECRIATNAHLHSVLAPQDRREQGQGFYDVFGIHVSSKNKSPFELQCSKGLASVWFGWLFTIGRDSQ